MAHRRSSLVVSALLSLFAACADDDDRAMQAGGELAIIGAPVTANVCPDGTTTFGIDVSKWQGNITWSSVKNAGVKYAIIRVSDGANTLDDKFAANWAGAKAQGILRSAYQFFRPGQNAVAQANVLLDAIAANGPSDLPPVLDVEATDGQTPATVASKIGQWMERVESVLGVKPIIYTAPYFWESNVASAAFAANPLWIAHWTNGCPSIPHQWSDWVFHQYSDSGSVSGIAGAVDLDRFNGTLAELQALGGGGAPTEPDLSIAVETSPPAGQARDFRPEGTSKDKLDLYEGQTFTADIYLHNAADAAVTTDVNIGIWFESPWLVPLGYTIYTDWPAKDRATWVVNDANDNPANPSHAAPPLSGQYFMYAMSPGETKRVSFSVRAAQYSIGQVDHPDVRAWVWHVPNWYGEQTGWSDPVEVNLAGGFLQAYAQHDVYARDRWTFEGPDAAETEGWAAGHAVSALALDLGAHALSIAMAGSDPYVHSGPALIDAGARKGIHLSARTSGGAKLSRLYFVTSADPEWDEAKAVGFVTPGDGAFHDLSIDLSGVATWSGTITQLRLDPAPDDTATYDLGELVSVASVAGTSGDGDGDGVLGAPGPDCDDADPHVAPDQPERCDHKDDDCDGQTDEGFDVGQPCSVGAGACLVQGHLACAEDGLGTACDAVPPESCGPTCLPGASGACPVAGAPEGCGTGVRHCQDDGTWGACALTPACGGPGDPGDPGGPDADSGGGAETSDASGSTTGLGADTGTSQWPAARRRLRRGADLAGGLAAALVVAFAAARRGARRRAAAAAVAASALALGACGDSAKPATTVDSADATAPFDVVFVDTVSGDSQVIVFDSLATDTARADSATATQPDTSGDAFVGPSGPWGFGCDGQGGEGCACDGAACAEGLDCLDTELGRLCLESCTAICDGDRRCATVGDGVRACVAEWSTLCAPCDTNADCLEVGARCVDFGFDGSFCASPCAGGTGCPGGFECKSLGQPAQTVRAAQPALRLHASGRGARHEHHLPEGRRQRLHRPPHLRPGPRRLRRRRSTTRVVQWARRRLRRRHRRGLRRRRRRLVRGHAAGQRHLEPGLPQGLQRLRRPRRGAPPQGQRDLQRRRRRLRRRDRRAHPDLPGRVRPGRRDLQRWQLGRLLGGGPAVRPGRPVLPGRRLRLRAGDGALPAHAGRARAPL
ncbi:MAG: GH25 family lysozyme [Myxococcota bacterium]